MNLMKQHGRRIPSLALSAGLALALGACQDDAVQRPPSFEVTDSAGQRHVRIGALDGIDALPWQATEIYDTQGGSSPTELFRVTAARLLEDGSLVAANSGTHELLLFDADGSRIGRMGGQGEGPGEFGGMSALDLDRAGNIVVYDPRLGRMTSFSPDGRVVATHRLAPPSRVVDLFPLATLDGGRVLAIFAESRMFAPDGERRDSTPLFLFDAEGGVADTLGTWPAQEWNYATMPGVGAMRVYVGFGRELAYAGRDGHSVLGATDSIDLTVFNREGRANMRIRGGGPAVPVDAAEVEEWLADRRESFARIAGETGGELPDPVYRTTYPGFANLLVDDARRIWIGAYPRDGQSERTWVIIGPDGDLHGTLTLPSEDEVLDAAAGRLAVLRRSDLGEERIVVLRLDPAETGM